MDAAIAVFALDAVGHEDVGGFGVAVGSPLIVFGACVPLIEGFLVFEGEGAEAVAGGGEVDYTAGRARGFGRGEEEGFKKLEEEEVRYKVPVSLARGISRTLFRLTKVVNANLSLQPILRRPERGRHHTSVVD